MYMWKASTGAVKRLQLKIVTLWSLWISHQKTDQAAVLDLFLNPQFCVPDSKSLDVSVPSLWVAEYVPRHSGRDALECGKLSERGTHASEGFMRLPRGRRTHVVLQTVLSSQRSWTVFPDIQSQEISFVPSGFCLPPSTHIAVFCLFLFGVMRDSTCRFGSLEIYSGICGQSRQESLGTYIRPSMSHKKATKIDQV